MTTPSSAQREGRVGRVSSVDVTQKKVANEKKKENS